jgi:L-ribulose-5-phosphate 3-epimerase
MKVGLSKLVMRQVPLSEFFDQAAGAGYECVELVMRQEGEITPKTPEDQLRRIVEQGRAKGLDVVSGEAQERGIAETEVGLRAAAAMGLGCTLHTLGRLRADLFYDDAYANAFESLRRLAPTCERLKVSIAIEFIWNGFLFSPLEMRQLLDEVGSPRVGFYFDPGNMAVFQFPHHWVHILGRHVKMVHLKDWKGTALSGGWPPLLQGDVDYAAMNHELRAIGYDGPMISEVPPAVASLEQTAAAIRRIIAM